MIQLIKTAIAFSDASNEYNYLRRIYLELNENVTPNIQELTDDGFTTREIEIITCIPKAVFQEGLRETKNEQSFKN